MDALAASYPAASAPAPIQPSQVAAVPKPAADAPDAATAQRTRADAASFSQEALRRLAQEQQARQTPSPDGTSGG